VQFNAGVDGFIRNWKADNKLMNLDNSGMIPDVDIKNIGIYGKLTYQINNNQLNLGLRVDNTKSQADKNAYGTANKNLCSQYYTNCPSSKTDTYLSGYILDKYYFDKKSYIYAGFGHSVRTPDPQERYIALKRPNMPTNKPDWVGNPNLKPSKNNEFDIGTNIKRGIFAFSINGFYSKVKDYIYLTKITSITNPSEVAVSYKNINATFYGADVNLKTFLTDFIYFDIGGAYQRGKKDEGTDKNIAEIPPLKIRGALTYDNLKYYGQIEVIHAFKQDKVDSTLNEQETPSYTVVNLKGEYRFKNFSVGAGINNVFDKFYYTHLSYLRDPFSSGMKTPEPGRFIYVNLAASF
jgi:iron complex outermembrane receptor protein